MGMCYCHCCCSTDGLRKMPLKLVAWSVGLGLGGGWWGVLLPLMFAVPEGPIFVV